MDKRALIHWIIGTVNKVPFTGWYLTRYTCAGNTGDDKRQDIGGDLKEKKKKREKLAFPMTNDASETKPFTKNKLKSCQQVMAGWISPSSHYKYHDMTLSPLFLVAHDSLCLGRAQLLVRLLSFSHPFSACLLRDARD